MSPEGAPRLMGKVLRAYHAASIAEDWPRLLRHLDMDLAYRARLLLSRGIGGALATLHPTIRWRSPCLEVNVRCYRDGEVDLAGRGLVLVPSVFVWPHPVFLLEEVKTQAGGNLSRYVNAALREQVRNARLQRLVAEHEAELGAIPAELLAEAEAEFEAAEAAWQGG